MENNEICMFMDVKLDIDKRLDTPLKYKTWTKCQVKIEAVKCFPCFLRINIKRAPIEAAVGEENEEQALCVTINVPGVNVSLAESRTKKYSYGLFWVQNRRDCYIYFALETEVNCRLHMKWIKKSIKNLELHRQICLEQRRCDRNLKEEQFSQQQQPQQQQGVATAQVQGMVKYKNVLCYDSIPKTPNYFDTHNSSWSRRISRASEIYEEIFEGTQFFERPRLSRRLSGASIASGIYEEMKPTALNFNAIVEEALESPAPPLPPPRKRFNTCEHENFGLLGEIPRSNTNPETELSKTKKYRNMFDSIFGSGRAKRAESVGESHATCVEDVIKSTTPRRSSSSGGSSDIKQQRQQEQAITHIYANDIVDPKRQRNVATAKRNSFSSPDLSKINFLDTFDEEKVADLLLHEFSSFDDLSFGPESLDESAVLPGAPSGAAAINSLHRRIYQAHRLDSLENLNLSAKLPQNFNFSAINSSTLNLIGANGATGVAVPGSNPRKHKVLIDELTGYCIMAPIKQKPPFNKNNNNINGASEQQNQENKVAAVASTESTSSGYSTGSYSSSTSSCLNSNEAHLNHLTATSSTVAEESSTLKFYKEPPTEESVIYENMNGSLNTTGSSKNESTTTPTTSVSKFTENLYENLLTIKAAQELEMVVPIISFSTSTPHESPMTEAQIDVEEEEAGNCKNKTVDEENIYQTPRKSIISVDEKIPSYYPNSCDTVKMRRYQAPTPMNNILTTPTSSLYESTNSLSCSFRHSQRKRHMLKENLNISPQKPNGAKTTNSTTSASTSPAASIVSTTSSSLSVRFQKTKRTAAHKISETVYAVTHAHRRSANSITSANQSPLSNYNNNNLEESAECYANRIKEKMNTEMLQLAMLQKIDFKFDDAKEIESVPNIVTVEEKSPKHKTRDGGGGVGHKQQPSQHYLQVQKTPNKTQQRTPSPAMMTQSKIEPKVSSASKEPDAASTASSSDLTGGGGGFRKFASLPRFKRIDLSPLKMRINNVLQRHQPQNTEF